MLDLLESFFETYTTIPSRPKKATKLAGQASYREYFRIETEDDKTYILMKMPKGASSVSEEITKTSKTFTGLPFIHIQKYLEALELPVPQVYGYWKEEGLLLLQDIGDQSLEKTLKNANREMTVFFYRQAIDLLIAFQEKTKKEDENCIAYHRRFDETLLNWEFDHFLEFGIEDRLRLKVDEADRKKFTDLTRAITQKIVAMPYGLTHRDFQSRNLHLYEYNFYMIDFQDALLGPKLYDLVALLRDSYINLDVEMRSELQNYYCEKVPADHPYHLKTDAVAHDFDLITIQRKLKDAGRFQFINTVKKNPSFLIHTPDSLAYVREALERRTEYKELFDLIGKYLKEFQ